MKKTQFIKNLVASGCYLKRHGGRHDIYANLQTGKTSPVPGHAEIKESLCRLIERQLDVSAQER